MRTTLAGWLCLVLCSVIVAGCGRRAPRPPASPVPVAVAVNDPAPQPPPAEKAQPPAKAKKDAAKDVAKEAAKAPPASGVLWTEEVKGWGTNEVEAEKHAMKKAVLAVQNFLRTQEPAFAWQPTPDFIRKNLMPAPPKRCVDEVQQEIGKETIYCWAWTYSVTPTHMGLMRTEDARFRAQAAVQERAVIAEARMLELAKLLGWAVLALTGLFAYIRADEWTRGENRRWLRVALGSLVIGGGMGWWLLS